MRIGRADIVLNCPEGQERGKSGLDFRKKVLSGRDSFWQTVRDWPEVTMRGLIVLLLAGTSLSAVSSMAQDQSPVAPGAPHTVQRSVTRSHLEDGGVSETMESIVVSSKAQAPFTLTLESEWVRMFADGGTITLANKRRIARDVAGRVYQERWFLVPKNGKVESQMTTIQIADPNAHTLYNCFFVGPRKNVCELSVYAPASPAVDITAKNVAGDLPNDQGSYVHEILGKQFISGIETVGVHDATIYHPGVFGNDRNVTVERESWYSPQLDLNLLSTRSDPRTGKQTFTATNVALGDPDPGLFEIPAGFKVVDRRQPAAPEAK
jgi:hypothetical protein